MTRQDALRRLVLLTFGLALGKLDALQAQGGQLTVNLDQWQEIVFKHKGRVVRVPVAEIFEALLTKTSPTLDFLRNHPTWNGLP